MFFGKKKYPHLNQMKEQAEAEVVPSSSLVEVDVEVGVDVGVEVDVEFEVRVEVGVEVEVKVRAQNYFLGLVVGWVDGEMKNKAIFQVEVEVEAGAWQIFLNDYLLIE